jgi:hypothetical protein
VSHRALPPPYGGMSTTTHPEPRSIRIPVPPVPPTPRIVDDDPAVTESIELRPKWAMAFERRLRHAVGDLGITVPQDWISIDASGTATFTALDRTAADRLVRTIEDVTGRIRPKRRPRRIAGQLALFEPPTTHLEAT